LWLKQSLFNL